MIDVLIKASLGFKYCAYPNGGFETLEMTKLFCGLIGCMFETNKGFINRFRLILVWFSFLDRLKLK